MQNPCYIGGAVTVDGRTVGVYHDGTTIYIETGPGHTIALPKAYQACYLELALDGMMCQPLIILDEEQDDREVLTVAPGRSDVSDEVIIVIDLSVCMTLTFNQRQAKSLGLALFSAFKAVTR